jgi:hypothetical protein
MIYAKFDWNWLAGSGDKDFLKISVYFYSFVIISLSFEQFKIPSPQGWFVPSLAKIGPCL